LGSGRSYTVTDVSPDDLIATKTMLEETGRYMCTHGCLLYNLCGATDPKDVDFDRKKNNTIYGAITELDYMSVLGCGVVIHTGSCKDRKVGIKNIVDNITTCLTKETPQTVNLAKSLDMPVSDIIRGRRIILENAAGEGNKIGNDIAELYDIVNMVCQIPKMSTENVTLCIDTCHIHAAGQFDFGKVEDIDKFFNLHDTRLVEVYHLNDSKGPFGCKKDRHEKLGNGYIFSGEGEEGLRYFMGKTKNVPLISETGNFTEDHKFINDIVKLYKGY
jgi:deoxyribonuclease-4